MPMPPFHARTRIARHSSRMRAGGYRFGGKRWGGPSPCQRSTTESSLVACWNVAGPMSAWVLRFRCARSARSMKTFVSVMSNGCNLPSSLLPFAHSLASSECLGHCCIRRGHCSVFTSAPRVAERGLPQDSDGAQILRQGSYVAAALVLMGTGSRNLRVTMFPERRRSTSVAGIKGTDSFCIRKAVQLPAHVALKNMN